MRKSLPYRKGVETSRGMTEINSAIKQLKIVKWTAGVEVKGSPAVHTWLRWRHRHFLKPDIGTVPCLLHVLGSVGWRALNLGLSTVSVLHLFLSHNPIIVYLWEFKGENGAIKKKIIFECGRLATSYHCLFCHALPCRWTRFQKNLQLHSSTSWG